MRNRFSVHCFYLGGKIIAGCLRECKKEEIVYYPFNLLCFAVIKEQQEITHTLCLARSSDVCFLGLAYRKPDCLRLITNPLPPPSPTTLYLSRPSSFIVCLSLYLFYYSNASARDDNNDHVDVSPFRVITENSSISRFLG